MFGLLLLVWVSTTTKASYEADPPKERPDSHDVKSTPPASCSTSAPFYRSRQHAFFTYFPAGFLYRLFPLCGVLYRVDLDDLLHPLPREAYEFNPELDEQCPLWAVAARYSSSGCGSHGDFHRPAYAAHLPDGSYKKERSFTWLTGVVLLGITMFLSFSGYLLPWDQLAYWAVTIGTSMAEAAPIFGKEVNLFLRGAPILAPMVCCVSICCTSFCYLGRGLVISIHYYKVAREHGISLPASSRKAISPRKRRKPPNSGSTTSLTC